jgi:single-strand DNA-binding protein
MRDLNKVMLIGNLTRDPELRSTPNGQSVATFSIATNRSWNDNNGIKQEAVEYVDIVVWGKLAEIVGQIYKKGRKTYIEGRLQTRSWEGQDGVKRQKTELIAQDLILLDRAPAGSQSENFSSDNSTAQVSPPETSQAQDALEDEINIEDIPF